METLHTIDEVAKILRLDPMTIYRYVKQKKIRASKLGHQFRIKESDLQAFLTDSAKFSTDKLGDKK